MLTCAKFIRLPNDYCDFKIGDKIRYEYQSEEDKAREQKDTSRVQSVRPWNKEILPITAVDQFDFLGNMGEKQEQKR